MSSKVFPNAVEIEIENDNGERESDTIRFFKIEQYRAGAAMTILGAHEDRDLRVVGIDSEGRVLAYKSLENYGRAGMGFPTPGTLVFLDKTPEDIAEVKLQTRFYFWREIKDIALPSE
ncbi:MAG: hypothetical protein ABIY70_04875 [Capsulimonas sp.]|uniref:hypothetical protein n=1 Tax=Capsulimonas sp. TaxID=2494211 RepID=UPI003264AA64